MKRTAIVYLGLAVLFVAIFNACKKEKRNNTNAKPSIRGIVYADNDFELYIDGKLIAADNIDTLPNNIVTLNFDAERPYTIALKATDYHVDSTGLEPGNTRMGKGGFILSFSDGAVSSVSWVAKRVAWGPLNLDICRTNPDDCILVTDEIPPNWTQPDFDDSDWDIASLWLDPELDALPEDFNRHPWGFAEFLWSQQIDVDNIVLFRHTVK